MSDYLYVCLWPTGPVDGLELVDDMRSLGAVPASELRLLRLVAVDVGDHVQLEAFVKDSALRVLLGSSRARRGRAEGILRALVDACFRRSERVALLWESHRGKQALEIRDESRSLDDVLGTRALPENRRIFLAAR